MKTIIIKKNLIVVCTIFILIVASFVGAASLYKYVSTVPQNGFTIVIDAGHGGRDGGVVGTITGTTEAQINLAIAKQLEKILHERGYKVVMTRKNSNGLYSPTSDNKKLADLKARIKIIENAKPDLVISIHQNAFPRSHERGAQVFYSLSGKQDIARTVQNHLNTQLPLCDRVAKAGDYYIINRTHYSSILVECGFLTTPEEEKLLVTSQYQQKVAFAIFGGVDSVLNIQNA
ncbi:MAG: N-acetylmuramoyl-L-alanine amidase [Clostridiales bacterium]|jgi:N-acetylmuramoyl-L-alanine amidase|nr:N-acetylmuramoyl-L-alanine amidase [Clostridiales bacterium]